MDGVLSALTEVCRDYDIVGIAEVNHFSIDSHEFQFELFKRLNIKYISLEILGPFTSLLVNEYIAGNIDVPLEDIFGRSYDPGLGTIRYIEYAKENNIKFIPTDYHSLVLSDKTLGLISKICSPTFMSNLVIENYKPVLLTKTEDIVENKCDRYIYDHMMNLDNYNKNTKKNIFESRLDFWYKNIVSFMDKIIGKEKLFIVGYHLQKFKTGSIGLLLKERYNFISLGMASAYIETRFCSEIFDKKTFKMKEYIKNQYEFGSKIMNYFDVYNKTKLEKKLEGLYKIVDTRKNRGFMHNFGIERYIIIKDGNRTLSYKEVYKQSDALNIKAFDYVIFIPKSTFDNRFYA